MFISTFYFSALGEDFEGLVRDDWWGFEEMGVDAKNEKALRNYIFWANDGFMAGLREEGRDDEKGFGYEGCEYHAQSIGKR